jgi:diguanylate cyclase (GGDEF)-like protein
MERTLMQWLERQPRRWTYPLAGLVLAMGAPVGYFIFRSLLAGLVPAPWWMDFELRERFDAYLYLTVATAIVFVKLGYTLGADRDRLRAESLTDPLTSLPNRRQVQERARKLLLERKPSEPVSLLLIDLDGSKQINETRGHEGGDRALCAVATTLRKVCRRQDAFGRYGGDEFIVMLPNMQAERAMRLAQRLCATMVDVAVAHGLGVLSFSIGVTDTSRAGTNTFMGLTQSADAALLVAKLDGKNRAHLSAPSDVERTLVRPLQAPARKGALS